MKNKKKRRNREHLITINPIEKCEFPRKVLAAFIYYVVSAKRLGTVKPLAWHL